jgi:hypothetical protein
LQVALLAVASVGLVACTDGTPQQPTDPPTSSATTAPVASQPAGDPTLGQAGESSVSEAAMLTVEDLGDGFRFESTLEGGPSGPDGNPEGWLGDSQWVLHLPYCDAYADLGVDGFYSRQAIRANTYVGPGGAAVVQNVERYPDAATASKVFQEARAVVEACSVDPFYFGDQRFPLAAGGDSWGFWSAVSDGRAYWNVVVRQGELFSIVRAGLDIGDVSLAVVDRLCEDTTAC